MTVNTIIMRVVECPSWQI